MATRIVKDFFMVIFTCVLICNISACSMRNDFCQIRKHFHRVSEMFPAEKDQANDLLLQQICYAADAIRSLKDCDKECTHCDTCVGFAQKTNQCYLCRTDIRVSHVIEVGLLEQFYISREFLDGGDQCFKTSGSGPHPTSCLRIWWMEAGCTMEGFAAPQQLNYYWSYWNGCTVSYAKYDMSLFYDRAMEGNGQYPLNCFGWH